MANGNIFSGARQIQSGFQTWANLDRREAEQRRRELLNRIREERLRRQEASFKQDYGFRPEGAGEFEFDRPMDMDRPESIGERRPETVGPEGPVDVERLRARIQEEGPAARAAGPASSAQAGTTPSEPAAAQAVKNLRTQGGSELTPGDVREGEAVARAADQMDLRRVEQPMAQVPEYRPAEEAEGRIPLEGGGSISAVSPQQRRQKRERQRERQQVQERFEALSGAFPQANPDLVRFAAMTGDVSVLRSDPNVEGEPSEQFPQLRGAQSPYDPATQPEQYAQWVRNVEGPIQESRETGDAGGGGGPGTGRLPTFGQASTFVKDLFTRPVQTRQGMQDQLVISPQEVLRLTELLRKGDPAAIAELNRVAGRVSDESTPGDGSGLPDVDEDADEEDQDRYPFLPDPLVDLLGGWGIGPGADRGRETQQDEAAAETEGEGEEPQETATVRGRPVSKIRDRLRTGVQNNQWEASDFRSVLSGYGYTAEEIDLILRNQGD